MLLTGTFDRSIDEKLRVAIPKQLRVAMSCPKDAGLYVAPETDKSLAIYSEEVFEQLAQRLAGVPPTRRDVRAYVRMFYGRAQQVPLDGQGRIRIPKKLAEFAELGKEAVLLGVQDHLELWATERWETYLTEKQAHYDEIAETAFGPRDLT